jgi:hypothetical protein
MMQSAQDIGTRYVASKPVVQDAIIRIPELLVPSLACWCWRSTRGACPTSRSPACTQYFDFDTVLEDGLCVAIEMCTLDVVALRLQGKLLIGMMFNTGSRWMAVYSNIDPPSSRHFGVFFYDSMTERSLKAMQRQEQNDAAIVVRRHPLCGGVIRERKERRTHDGV